MLVRYILYSMCLRFIHFSWYVQINPYESGSLGENHTITDLYRGFGVSYENLWILLKFVLGLALGMKNAFSQIYDVSIFHKPVSNLITVH